MIIIKALLCIHGLLSSNIDYSYINQFLKYKYDFISTPNIPGHGTNLNNFNVNNTLSFILFEYDKLNQIYDEIHVIGYSLGGVLACYLSQYRNIHKLILLAPAFDYINFKAYKPKLLKKGNIKLKNTFEIKKIKYFYHFSKIVNTVEPQIQYILCPVCIIWGEDDVLVNYNGCLKLYKRALNNNKYFITLKNVNHTSILYSDSVFDIILKFIE